MNILLSVNLFCSYELLRPNGSKGNKAEVMAARMNNPAQTYKGAEVAVLASVATTAEMIPIMRLQATLIPLPEARCALGRTSGV